MLQLREKLIKYGVNSLKNFELFALILRTGCKNRSVIKLSKQILAEFQKSNIPNLRYQDLKNFTGLGPSKISTIVASFELSKRLITNKQTQIYLKPQQIFQMLFELRYKKREHFVVLYLNNQNQEVKRSTVAIGSSNINHIVPRDCFVEAVKASANSIIIAHNHPSGTTEPSDEDILVTKRLTKAGEIIGIKILDHIIIGKDEYFSMKENNLLTI